MKLSVNPRLQDKVCLKEQIGTCQIVSLSGDVCIGVAAAGDA